MKSRQHWGMVGLAALLAFGMGSSFGASLREPEVRKIDGRKDRVAFARIAHFRALLPEEYRERRNFAWASVEIPGQTKTEYFAHSSIHNLEPFSGNTALILRDISPRPDGAKATFKVLCVNQRNQVNGDDCWERDVDTECKILEDLTARLPNQSISGSIVLYTDLYPCASCWNVMKQFLARYPHIEMLVLYRIR